MKEFIYGTVFVFIFIQVFAILRLFQYASRLDLKGMKEGRSIIRYLSQNLMAAPISNITFEESKCPLGFETMNLGFWPGLAKGCYCKTGLKFKTMKCTENDLDAGCQNIRPIAAKKYGLWKGRKMCVQRMEVESFDKLHFECPTPEPCCQEGFRLCAEDLCVQKDKICPITSLKVATAEDKKNGETVNFDNKTYYAFTRESKTSRQIISFEVSRAPIPCLDPNVQDDGDGKPYPYLNPSRIQESCGRWGFNTLYSQTADNMSEAVLLKENGIYPSTQNNLPEYDTFIKESKVFLSSRATIKVVSTGNCQFFSPTFLNNFENDFVGLYKTIVIVEIIHSLALIATTVVMFYSLKLLFQWLHKNQNDRPNLAFYAAGISLLILMVFTGIRYFICKSYVRDAIESNHNLLYFVNEKCIGDFRYTEALSQIKPGNIYERINSMNWVILVLTGFLGVVIFFLGCLLLKKKQEDNKEYDEKTRLNNTAHKSHDMWTSDMKFSQIPDKGQNHQMGNSQVQNVMPGDVTNSQRLGQTPA